MILGQMIASEPGMEVVGEAADGKQALNDAARVKPDVILMDVMMPVMDGLEATREMMQVQPVPIVLVSELVGRDADLNFKALEAGAIDVLRKPSAEQSGDESQKRRFLRQVRSLSQVPVVRRRARPAAVASGAMPRNASRGSRTSPELGHSIASLVCIGASTGGPPAIRQVLMSLGKDFPQPVVIVQHMTEGFIGGMVKWLEDTCPDISVKLATQNTVPEPGIAYLAPDDCHLEYRRGRLVTNSEHLDRLHRPCIDVFFESVASGTAAARATAVLLTGMGADGAQGLLKIREAGGKTIAQDEASSVVFGMPGVAAEIGAAEKVLALEHIGPHLRRVAKADPA